MSHIGARSRRTVDGVAAASGSQRDADLCVARFIDDCGGDRLPHRRLPVVPLDLVGSARASSPALSFQVLFAGMAELADARWTQNSEIADFI
jgi:hypothetical protein